MIPTRERAFFILDMMRVALAVKKDWKPDETFESVVCDYGARSGIRHSELESFKELTVGEILRLPTEADVDDDDFQYRNCGGPGLLERKEAAFEDERVQKCSRLVQ